MSPAPNIRHLEVVREIYFAISLLLRKNPLGKVLIAPTDVRLPNQNILQPGILFVKNENLYKIKEKGIEGAPELVVEVLSPFPSQPDYEEKKMLTVMLNAGTV